MINLISQQTAALAVLQKDNEERKTREASQQKKEEDTPILGSRLMLTQGELNLVLHNLCVADSMQVLCPQPPPLALTDRPTASPRNQRATADSKASLGR